MIYAYEIKKTASNKFEITSDPQDAPELIPDSAVTFGFKIEGLPKAGSIGEGNAKVSGQYTYFATEMEAVSGYNPGTYSNPPVSDSATWITGDYATDGGKIINRPVGGYELPQTGGIGTTLFTALGGLMTVAAGAVLTLRMTASRRRGEKQAS